MPNRPNRLSITSAKYNPPRLPATAEYEILPEVAILASSASPTTNLSGPSSMSPTQFVVLRFNLRGFADGLLEILKGGLVIPASGNSNPQVGLVIGKVKNNIDSFTNAATYNTYNGTNNWAEGVGTFRDVASEISWTPSKMPGVSNSNCVSSEANQGTTPTRGLYHSRYDTNFPVDEVAALLNSALDAGEDSISIYIYTASSSWGINRGNTDSNAACGIRLVLWEYNINPGLRWVGGENSETVGSRTVDSDGFLFPAAQVYESAPSSNTNCYGAPTFDMTSASSSSTGSNTHGGTAPTTRFDYALSTTDYVLMHFDLSEFLGRTFEEVLLRINVGTTASGSGSTADVNVYVAQAAHPWGIGSGGGAAATSGPTYIYQNKSGSALWPGSVNVADSGFIDTTGQAETLFSGCPYTQFNNNVFTTSLSVDITDMVNRALSTYAGQLYLRLRLTKGADTSGGATPNLICGPTGFTSNNATAGGAYRANITTSNTTTSAGYRSFPHLQMKEADPFP